MAGAAEIALENAHELRNRQLRIAASNCGLTCGYADNR